MERMRVSVRVHPIIREFLIDTIGSDTITPKKGDLIWAILKQNLETAPENFREPIDIDNHIYIELLDCHSCSTYSVKSSVFLHINTMFRWHLSEKGQNRINSILRANFKTTMHCFIQGAISCNPELQQREAMEEFCNTYNLTMNKITPDMIKKSWDRSDHKRKLVDTRVKLNSIFF